MVDMLSQEEIDALLSGGGNEEEKMMSNLTLEEKDALGEVGNICMGTAATTLFTLLGQKVTITTPKVSEITYNELLTSFQDPCVLINVKYTAGIEGVNILLLAENDVKIITDLMMGGDGTSVSDELTDLHLSAIGEAMNQMIGSSSTSLSEMLGAKVDISPPEPHYDNLADMSLEDIGVTNKDSVVRVQFRMTVGDLIDSEISQVMPLDVAKQLVLNLLDKTEESIFEEAVEPIQPQYAQTETQSQDSQAKPVQHHEQPPQYAPPQYAQPQYAPPQYAPPQYAQQPMQNVNAQPVQFESFDDNNAVLGYNNNINIIKDVPLDITVELGRTTKRISEILDFAPGSVIELDKIVGEPLDVLANGKKIATGEVVVVDENYGIKITDIVVPEKRLGNI